MSDIIPNFPSTSGVLVKSHEESNLTVCDCYSAFGKAIFKSDKPHITIGNDVFPIKVLQIVHLKGDALGVEYLIEEKQ